MSKSTTRQLRGTPGIPALHKMLTKAVQEPGFSNEVSWHNHDGQQITLEVILPVTVRVPHWQVFLKRIDEKILLGEYHGHDTLMVFKNVSAIAESEPVEHLDDAAKLAKVMEIRLKAGQVSTRDDLPVPDFADQPKPSAVYLSRLTENRLPALAPGGAPDVDANRAAAGPVALAADGAPDSASDSVVETPASPQPQQAEEPALPTESKSDSTVPQDQDEGMISSYLTTRSSARKSRTKAVEPPPEEKPFDPTASYTDITAVDPAGHSKLGNLTDTPLTELLFHLKEEQFTGRVRLEREGQSAVMFFEGGLPVDASHGEARGNMAVMELFLWKDGHFKITPSKPGSNRSVTWSVDTILQNKTHLMELINDLESAGMCNSSTFKQTCPQITHEQFLTALGSQTPTNVGTLKLLYQQMDGRKALADFENLTPFPKHILLRCLHYLMSRNLIFIANKSALAKEKRALKEKKIDAAAVRSVMLSLRNKDTGLLTPPAFLYFIEEEFFRSFRSRSSMSLLLVDLRQIECTADGVSISLVSRQTLADAALQIFNCKRQTDGAGHYEAQIIAMFLPNTNLSGATTMAKKIQKVLSARPLAGMEGKALAVTCAIAGIPEDCTNLHSLLASADCALQKAISEGLPIVRYRDAD
ncbi:MAG: DUF4388 domain-containing protein [Candidatus Obscuribacterales bacterium]